MRKLMLVTPVFRRFYLTRLMLEQRVKTFQQAQALDKSTTYQCVCIGDHENVELARSLGFVGLERENVLGAKYNDGHEWAVNSNYDISFHCNSDQVFDPRLLVALANAPTDKLIRTIWLTAVHPRGNGSLSYRDQHQWTMTAYPVELLKHNPRPCGETLARMCDSSTREGVVAANPKAGLHTIQIHPLETIQFESGFQLTPWKNNFYRALRDHRVEQPVPWAGIAEIYGDDFTSRMKEFYGVNDN